MGIEKGKQKDNMGNKATIILAENRVSDKLKRTTAVTPRSRGEIMGRIRLGISACLLGENVRYDGRHKLDRFLTDTLGQYVEYVPVCPEVECGLPVPRESMHLEGGPESPRLVTSRTKRI